MQGRERVAVRKGVGRFRSSPGVAVALLPYSMRGALSGGGENNQLVITDNNQLLDVVVYGDGGGIDLEGCMLMAISHGGC